MPIYLSCEELAYWYLRLNGFLTTTNFVVHPDSGNQQETDVDIIGVRFPHRAENLLRPMEDDAPFAPADRVLLRIGEVKRGRCELNGPWTNPARENMLRVLRAIGPFPEQEARHAAKALHAIGAYQTHDIDVALTCFGSETNPEIARNYPEVKQLLWPDMLRFIHQRFRDYRKEKVSHAQWDRAGQDLWSAADATASAAEFLENVKLRG